ncbi:hypothetical protein XOC_1930 [Xanthomonas oryzae pv. oryzicola BLS256]|uniref:Uncharacterized protein n=1 Tax=Xanthomonas oryzae pv. oryzicola (strain BLS256) TaxID=383407 RepID=G7TBL3_XANOB|nr:hypothetical protein XOC_1930 [Xanthomonas oryzae pv. oryzicola BLS256]QEO97982.1 hypothetical protein XOCgx_2993 [Xanthomonas oryzae pv. oryzicola]
MEGVEQQLGVEGRWPSPRLQWLRQTHSMHVAVGRQAALVR